MSVNLVGIRTEVIIDEDEAYWVFSDPFSQFLFLSLGWWIVLDVVIVSIIGDHEPILLLCIINDEWIVIIPVGNSKSLLFLFHFQKDLHIIWNFLGVFVLLNPESHFFFIKEIIRENDNGLMSFLLEIIDHQLKTFATELVFAMPNSHILAINYYKSWFSLFSLFLRSTVSTFSL